MQPSSREAEISNFGVGASPWIVTRGSQCMVDCVTARGTWKGGVGDPGAAARRLHQQEQVQCQCGIRCIAGTGVDLPAGGAKILQNDVKKGSKMDSGAGNVPSISRGSRDVDTSSPSKIRLQEEGEGKIGGGWWWWCGSKGGGWFPEKKSPKSGLDAAGAVDAHNTEITRLWRALEFINEKAAQ
ncbi:hypothetical protein DFH06DRAFT_1376102 [Mycena polygramma]|nr:hypothetical protein DFH06DRAFT_1376102 [Mycena polygramma]